MAHGGEFAPDSKLVTLALAVAFASSAINAQVILECSSGFVYCLDGMLICEPNRILCIDGRLVCASKFTKHSCSLSWLSTTSTEPPHHTHQPSSSDVGSNWTSSKTPETEFPTLESSEPTPSEVGVKTSSSDVGSDGTSSKTPETEFPTFESSEPTPPKVETSFSGDSQGGTSSQTGESQGSQSGSLTTEPGRPGSPSSEAYPTRSSLKPVTKRRLPWEIHLQMKTRFLRLFATAFSSRGIKLRNLRFSYVDNYHPGVRVHAKTVRGIFSGGRPELSVAGAKFTQNALDYILQLPILLLHPGEVTAKLQFKYTNRHITSWMPVRIKLGFVKFLATVAVKKATGMGSWVGLKATKIFIQKYSVTSGADYWILKKMGRRAVNQLVKEMMKTKFLEDALTFYLTKLWRRMAFPVFNVRG